MLNNSTIQLKDGTVLYYKDWGPSTGQPVVFSHGWPLSSDAFEDQMLALASKGYRTIAHDRRGHGRSSQPWEGHNMDRYADDLAELMEALNVHNAVLIGHSTGGGEVARYIARHGISRVAKTVLISSVPPIMLKTDFNPEGSPVSVFDDIREGVINDRSHYFKELPDSFYGFNRPNATPSEGLRDGFWRQGMMGSIKALHDCIKVFSETDQREDLKKMTVPTLVLYGTDDQIVPPAPSSEAAAKLLPNPTVKSYPGASHGLCSTHKFEINQDLLKFIKDGTV